MPSLFLVGDPKQSIYRFRNAEPRVFIDAQNLVQNLGGALLICEHTRRNAPAIIDALNRVLGAAEMTGFRPHTTEVAAPGDGIWALPREPRPPRAARRRYPCSRWWHP